MGMDTKIEWAHHTWNPWQGCHKVSPGCLNCYMETTKKRFKQDPNNVHRSAFKTFYAPPRWDNGRVFVCSWSDFFIEEADPWRREAWEVMALNPQLTFLILTKRPENIAARLPDHWAWPMANVWLGVTAENQEMADKRIPILLETEATKRFISVEPMLGPIDLQWPKALHPDGPQRCCDGTDCGCKGLPVEAPLVSTLDWVICGCESGPGSRETKIDWVHDLMYQCVDAKVPFFLKQLRSDLPMERSSLIKMPQFNGRVWDQVPGEVE